MKKALLILAAIAGTLTLNAQNKKGGIDAKLLGEISKGYEGTAADKALRNALNTTAINTLALNADNIPMDTRFSDVVKTKGRTNQLSSGRCWLFTGLNVMRAKMIDKFDMGPVILSQNYVFFYDQLEKANLFLQGIIDTKNLPDDDRMVDWLFAHPIGDGGQFTGVSNLIMKYGVVPSEVFPESMIANNTAQMRAQITNKLREDGLRLRQAPKGTDLQAMKTAQLKEIYRILALCLGVPPTEFTWTRTDSKGNVVSTKQYTPKSFYEEYIGTDLEHNYIMVMNDPCHEYYKIYEIDYDRHVYDGENWVYLNLPIDEIKQVPDAGQGPRGPEQLRLRVPDGRFLRHGQEGAHLHARQRLHARDDAHRGGPQGRQAGEVDGGEQLGRELGLPGQHHHDGRVVQRVHVPPGRGQEVRPGLPHEILRPETHHAPGLGPDVPAGRIISETFSVPER